MTEKFKSGFIAIVGPTNSGKSTLLNALMGKKISIVSPKVQTTYRPISGVVTDEQSQTIYTDMPGYQRHREPVARLLSSLADKRSKDCDAAVWVFDASKENPFNSVLNLKDKITNLKDREHSFCVLNKVDKVAKPNLLPLIHAVWELGLFREIIPLSAKTGKGVPELAKSVNAFLPEGDKLFPEGYETDRTKDFLVSEFVREKIYQATYLELPYSSWIEIEEWTSSEENGTKCDTIRAVVHVDSSSRKAILIGKSGEMMKKIGMEARKEIEKFLGRKICLKLHVDVQEKWREDSRFLGRYLELE